MCIRDRFLAVLNDTNSEICITAERRMNQCLDGGCSVPIAGFAQLEGDTVFLQGVVGDVDSGRLLSASAQGNASIAAELGQQVAQQLIDQGAKSLIAKAQ